MNESHTYNILPYSEDLAAELAVMWNESDDQWPGTFTRGIPMTADRVKQWMSETDYLMNLVVQRDDGVVVGYGNLFDTPNQKGVSCYVPLLNVHPAYQGKSLCRRMLNQMVDYATAHGYRRMTIATWSGNMKSVPLYKKVGFYWVPGHSVFMENYTPVVRQLPFAQDFFAEADWYRSYTRTLDQKEDEQRHPETGDMKVYVGRWETADRYLEAIIDREGQSVTGVETEQFAAFAMLEETAPAQGFPSRIRWRLTNKLDAPMPVTLCAEAAPGITLSYQETLTLAPQETREISRTFVCASDAPAIHYNESRNATPRPQIKTQLQMGTAVVPLATGIPYRPPVTVTLTPEIVSLLPGQPQQLLVHLETRQPRLLSGHITITHDGTLHTDWAERPFTLEPYSSTNLPLTLSRDAAGGAVCTLTVTLDHEDGPVTLPAIETAVLAVPLGGIAAVQLPEEIVVENAFYQARALQKGGRVKLWDKVTDRNHVFFREEIGPPFSPHDLEDKPYALSLTVQEGMATAVFQVTSTRIPDLHLMRTVQFNASPLLHVTHTLHNRGADLANAQVMVRLFMNDTEYGNGRAYVPRPERLITSITSLYPARNEDFPEEPGALTEQWAAFEIDGQIHGVVWTTAAKHKLRWGYLDLESESVSLAPAAQTTLPSIWVYCGSGRWQDVRSAWLRLNGGQTAPFAHPTPQPPVQVALQPSPLLTISDDVAAQVTVDNVAKTAVSGALTLALPDGWQTATMTFAPPEVQQNTPWSESITITAPATPQATVGSLTLATALNAQAFPVPLIRLGDARHAVETAVTDGADGHPLWTLANGRCRWQIAPAYQAGVVGWFDGADVNHVLSKYPHRDATFATFTPFLGGIVPELPHPEQHDWFGKLYTETFQAKPAAAPDSRGLPWQGVKLVSRLQRELDRGLRAEIAYLTLPGSNVLKMVYRLVNETAVTRTATPQISNHFQVDGDYRNAVLVNAEIERRRTTIDYWEWHHTTWTAVTNPDSGRTLIVVRASGKPHMFVADMGKNGAHVLVGETTTLPPYGAQTLVTYLALADSPEAARPYAALHSVGEGF